MVVTGLNKIVEFVEEHPEAKPSLTFWLKTIESNDFEHFVALKQSFNSVDFDGRSKETIFDIGGNKFRLICVVVYTVNTVRIIKVLTHEQYTKRIKRR
jgi:mRNA interferase HigB